MRSLIGRRLPVIGGACALVGLAAAAAVGAPLAGGASTPNAQRAAAAPATATCALDPANGKIKHVVQVQFDNTHLMRDAPSIPSDLEQMPHLLGFLTNQGTLTHDD